MTDPRCALADQLARSLEEVLDRVDAGEGGSADALAHAWAQCDAAFLRLKEWNEAHPGEETPVELRERLDRVLRLNAVAKMSIGRELEAVGVRLDGLADVRRYIRSADSAGSTGRSCDMSG